MSICSILFPLPKRKFKEACIAMIRRALLILVAVALVEGGPSRDEPNRQRKQPQVFYAFDLVNGTREFSPFTVNFGLLQNTDNNNN